MAYTKATVSSFESKLVEGGYKNSTAALRAVAKCGFTGAQRDKCLAAISKYFPTAFQVSSNDPTPAPVAKKRKAVAKKAKRAVKAEEAPQPVVEVKRRGRRKAEDKPVIKKRIARTNHKSEKTEEKLFNNTKEQLSRITLAKERVGTLVQAIGAMQAVKDVNPQVDTKRGTQAVQDSLTGVAEGIRQDIEGLDPNVVKRFLDAKVALSNPVQSASEFLTEENPDTQPES